MPDVTPKPQIELKTIYEKSTYEPRVSVSSNRLSGKTVGALVGNLNCDLGEWQSPPRTLGEVSHDRLNTWNIFGPQSGVGSHTALVVYFCQTKCEFGPFPYMVSSFSFVFTIKTVALALQTVHLRDLWKQFFKRDKT